MRRLFKNFKNSFSCPTFSVCFFPALPFKTNTLLSLGSLATAPNSPSPPVTLRPAPLNQWLYSCQPLIMFSAHFLSLARLHLSLKIHNSSCDHGTSPRIPLSTSGREGGGGWSTKTVRIWKLGYEGIISTNGLSTQAGWRGGLPPNPETVEGIRNYGRKLFAII